MLQDRHHARKTGISNLDRSHLSRILENPLYVRADKEVYRYFLSKGYEMLDEIEAYDGIHGLFVHAGLDDTHFVKVAYHEGLVPAETWLRVVNHTNSNHDISSHIRHILSTTEVSHNEQIRKRTSCI